MVSSQYQQDQRNQNCPNSNSNNSSSIDLMEAFVAKEEVEA